MTKLPPQLITDPDIRESFSEDAAGNRLTPDFVARPTSSKEIQEIARYCSANGISITPAGGQSTYTAASLSDSGVCLVTTKLASIVELDKTNLFVDVEPGIYLAELKQTLKEHDLFYPPSPTSEAIATVGGTFSTNACGSSSYKYGATRKHVAGFEAVLADGSQRSYQLTPGQPLDVNNPASLWVGSEGILGVVTRIRLKLQLGIPEAFSLMVFFKNLEQLLTFAVSVHKKEPQGIAPRAIEFMDAACLELLREQGSFSQIPLQANGAIIFEQEYLVGKKDSQLDAWLSALEATGAMVEDSLIADTEAKKTELKALRHFLPSTLNEVGLHGKKTAGGKISTDWAVPLEKLPQMISQAEALCSEFGFSPENTFRFGHLGNGHPHYNLMADSAESFENAKALRLKLSALAVSLGGTAAREHGIGKLRKDLRALEGETEVIIKLRALKQELDPKCLMSPGNLF